MGSAMYRLFVSVYILNGCSDKKIPVVYIAIARMNVVVHIIISRMNVVDNLNPV
jgi:hypothetical protein